MWFFKKMAWQQKFSELEHAWQVLMWFFKNLHAPNQNLIKANFDGLKKRLLVAFSKIFFLHHMAIDLKKNFMQKKCFIKIYEF